MEGFVLSIVLVHTVMVFFFVFLWCRYSYIVALQINILDIVTLI
jgi:hypothetical protein